MTSSKLSSPMPRGHSAKIKRALMRGGITSALAVAATLGVTAATAEAMPPDPCAALRQAIMRNNNIADHWFGMGIIYDNLGYLTLATEAFNHSTEYRERAHEESEIVSKNC
jgi:hypothetical protein